MSNTGGTGQIWYKILSCGKNFYGVARSSPREQRSSALHLVFQICQHCFSKQKTTCRNKSFLFAVSVHFRYRSSKQVPARFVALFFFTKIINIVSNPSSRIRVTVHRTVSINGSNLTSTYQKRHTPNGVCLFCP